jgi:hypothetical protein
MASKKKDVFVQIPIWWLIEATKATRTPRAMVFAELLFASWKKRRLTVPLPNGRLGKLGVSRETKRRALRDLEKAGLITVDRHHGKTPKVTLVVL